MDQGDRTQDHSLDSVHLSGGVRILFLCHRVPYPPDKGEKIRAFHQLRALAARHEVDLFTLADDPADLAHRNALAAHCRHVTIARVFPRLARLRSLPYLLTRTPLTVPYFRSAWLQEQVCGAIAERHYDRVFVYCSAMAQYVDWNSRAFRAAHRSKPVPPVPLVLDLVDVDSNKWAQYAAATTWPFSAVFRKESRDLRTYERRACAAAASVLVSTEREAELAREIAPTARVHVVPVGVDAARFEPPAPTQQPPTVVFAGDMGYFPNRDGVIFFAQEVLPLIRQQIPDARFLVVGRNPDRRLKALGQLDNVQVTGSVPDVRPWLAQASVSVVPLRIAAGIQTKILEAMAAGLPVVATSRAVQGLTAPIVDLIKVGDTAAELAGRVVGLLRNPDGAAAHGLEGRRRIATEYDWKVALDKLVRLVEDPTGEAGVPAGAGDAALRLAFDRPSAVGGL